MFVKLFMMLILLCSNVAFASEPFLNLEGRVRFTPPSVWHKTAKVDDITLGNITYHQQGMYVDPYINGRELNTNFTISTNYMIIEQFTCEGNVFVIVNSEDSANLLRLDSDNNLINKFSFAHGKMILNPKFSFLFGVPRLYVYDGRLYAWFFPTRENNTNKAAVFKFCWYAPELTFQIEQKYLVDISDALNPLRLEYTRE